MTKIKIEKEMEVKVQGTSMYFHLDLETKKQLGGNIKKGEKMLVSITRVKED